MSVINITKKQGDRATGEIQEVSKAKYDRDYFENGVALGISMYENYRWLPELTMRMAHFLIKRLGIEENHTVLDFGCAKGYLVKALRLLGIKAYGCDISEYAIKMVDPEVEEYCRLSFSDDFIPFPEDLQFDWLIAKDVFEHLEEEYLQRLLKEAYKRCERMFVVVPLGENDRFVVPEYEKDTTHVLAKNTQWWRQIFYANGWQTKNLRYHMTGLKENWAQRYPRGNGLFTLERMLRANAL
ncbi:MAG: hypothetical protein DRH17_00865 [Deltaproteobacteria bacterium]|nr:MAG: hypothetical protein DRH17_00865 [Deltaproteobacteria bacterium]